MNAVTTIIFEDDGQDFLEWDIGSEGKIIDSRPFQAGIWGDRTVKNKEMEIPLKPGGFVYVTTLSGQKTAQVNHRIKEVVNL